MEQFFCKTKIITGCGSLSALAELHIKRLFIVSDPFFQENGTTNHIAHISQAAQTEVFSKVVPDPSVTLVAEGVQAAQQFQPDAILALGGGSAMDCAKAVHFFSGKASMLIAVPTTSGSGSEVTNFAILTHDGIKHPLVDDRLQPDLAILDGSLLTSLPAKLVADSGFDLIVHALEAWVAKNANQISDALALQALQIAFRDLPRSFAGDPHARMAVHTAATMAGMAFSSAGLGACHAISHALGGQFHTPHGRLNAILLPAVLEFHAASHGQRYAALARQLQLSSGADAVATRALKQALLRLRRGLQLPATLAEVGIAPRQLQSALDTIAAAALSDSCCATAPDALQIQDIRQILLSVMGNG